MSNLDFALYFNIAFFGILGLSTLVGLIRGMKKSLYAFITMAIFYVVFFLTVDAVVGKLWTMEISQLGGWLANIDPALSGVTSFSQAVPVMLANFLEGSIDPNLLSEDVLALIAGIGIFALKLVYTVLYFTVILVLYKLLAGIIRMIFFGSRKGEAKNPLFGAIFGLANGALALFVTLIMLGGVMSVAESLAVLAPASSDPAEVTLSMPRQDFYEASYSVIPLAEGDPLPGEDLFGGEDPFVILQTLVSAYNANLLVQAAGIITIPNEAETLEVPLNLYLFDMVISFEFEGQTVALRNELAVFAAAGQILMNSEFATDGDIAKLQGQEIRDVFDLLAASDFLVSAMPVAIELAADNFDVDLAITPEELRAIDWHAELLQIGSIAGSILDILNSQEAGSDTITVEGDDIRELFNAMGDSQLALLASEAFLEPWLSDPENEVTAFLTIPANLDWETEFPAIGEALGAIFDETGSFVLNDLGLNAIYNMSDATIGLIFDSRILVATISTVLTSQDLGGTTLVIPDSVFDTEGYLTQAELTALARAIKLVVTTATCDPADTECEETGFDAAQVLTLTGAEIDTLLSSEIIAATMGKLIYDLGSEQTTLVIPNAVKDTVLVDAASVNVVDATEIKAVFQALMAIDVADFDGMSFDAGIIEKLEDDAVPGTLDDDKLTALFASQILHATISKMLLDLTEGTGAVLTIPELDPSGNPIVTTVGTMELVSVNELKAALNAMYAIGTNDFQTLSNISVTTILDDIGILLDSAILHATISDMLLTSTGGVLIIPDVDDLANPIRIEQGTTTYVSEAEILAIVAALDELNLDDLEAVSLTPAVIFEADYATILDSATMRASFSDTILAIAEDETAPVGTTTLIVPTSLREDLLVNGVTITDGQIQKAELIALLDSLDLLGITNFDDAFNAGTITGLSGATIMTLLESGSIHITINNMLMSNGNIDDYIPALALSSQYGVAQVILDTEIRDFILAVQKIGGNFTNASLNAATIVGMNASDRGVVLQSMIVRNGIQEPVEDLVDVKNAYNTLHALPTFNVDGEDYEQGNVGLFFTYADVLDIANFLNSDYSVLD